MIVTFESPSPDENWSPRGLAALIGKRQSSGDDAKYLIAPTSIEETDNISNRSCAAAKTPKKPKNHLRANRQALKEKQQNNKCSALARQAEEKLRRQKLEKKKERLYGKITSRICHPPASSVPASPSSPTRVGSPSRASSSPAGSTYHDDAFHIAFGKKIGASPERPSTSAASVASSSARHKSFGKTPAYITNRKAKIEREEEVRQRAREEAPPAPGLVLLADSERRETLRILEENEREAWEALRSIPFSMNEQKAARRREAIQFRLNEIEDTRKIFSKDKVFVSQNG